VLSGRSGSLADQLERQSPAAPPSPRAPASRASETPSGPVAIQAKDLLYWNGFGGFTPDGREYVIVVDGVSSQAPALPPAPWTNVVANPRFGCLTTEAGLGYTWSDNSQTNRLTPWSNDPVSDAPGEIIYLRDEATKEIWTPTPLPLGHRATVTVHHGQGCSRYESHSRHLKQEVTVYLPAADPVKIMNVRLTSDDIDTRHLSVTYFAEWVLGTHRDDAAMQLVCSRDEESGAIIAQNRWSGDFT